jgi:hypothetical protein
MARRRNQNLVERLALARAGGRSVKGWCKANKVSVRTAYGWTKLPSFQVLVDQYRGAMIDQAIGQATKHINKNITVMANLRDSATNESVRLAAARGLIADLTHLQGFAEFERRLTALEQASGSDPKKRTDAAGQA